MPDPDPILRFAREPSWRIAMNAFFGSLGLDRAARERVVSLYEGAMEPTIGVPVGEEAEGRGALGTFARAAGEQALVRATRVVGPVGTPGEGVAVRAVKAGAARVVKAQKAAATLSLKQSVAPRVVQSAVEDLRVSRELGKISQKEFLEELDELDRRLVKFQGAKPRIRTRALAGFGNLLDRMVASAGKVVPAGTGRFMEKAIAASPAALGAVAGAGGIALAVRSGLLELEKELDRRDALRREAAGLPPAGSVGDE